MSQLPAQENGFTLIELIVVISLVGILAAFAIPRFFAADGFSTSTAQNELVSTARYAQQLGMNQAQSVRLVINNSDYGVQLGNAWISSPSGDDYPLPFPRGVTSTAQALAYNRLGDTGLGVTATITLRGGGENLQVCIEPTGYAHGC